MITMRSRSRRRRRPSGCVPRSNHRRRRAAPARFRREVEPPEICIGGCRRIPIRSSEEHERLPRRVVGEREAIAVARIRTADRELAPCAAVVRGPHAQGRTSGRGRAGGPREDDVSIEARIVGDGPNLFRVGARAGPAAPDPVIGSRDIEGPVLVRHDALVERNEQHSISKRIVDRRREVGRRNGQTLPVACLGIRDGDGAEREEHDDSRTHPTPENKKPPERRRPGGGA
jgi:hypothetical protein